MRVCERCGSYAINPTLHGRNPGKDLDRCDVCYWRKRAEVCMEELRAIISEAKKYEAETGKPVSWADDVIKILEKL